MKKISVLVACVLSLAVPLFAEGSKEAKFPTKGIEMLVPYAPGGGTDAVARALAASAEKFLGQPITIINKAGGGGAVGWAEVAKARPDGYKITMFAPNIVNLSVMGLSPVGIDDFEPICMVNNDPGVIIVAKKNAGLNPVDMLKDTKYKSGGENPNFYLLTIEAITKVKLQDIPYNGAAERIPAVLGGHVDFAIVNVGEAKGQLDAGEIVPLAVLDSKRMTALPNVPTLKELGIDAQKGAWRGLAAPKGTPKEIVAKLEDAFTKASKEPAFVEFMKKAVFNIDFKSSVDFKAFMVAERETTKKMLGK
jgi:tripartite-type tricarboxylate transporter receptor subunit TctC